MDFKEDLMKSLFKILGLVLVCCTVTLSLFACHSHEWGEWETVKAPSCEENGEETRICLSDGEHTESRPIPALGHSFGGDYTTSSVAHWQYCQNEGCKERLAVEHVSDSPATEEVGEYCTVCGYEIEPKLHMLSNKKIIFIGNSFTYFGGVVKEVKQNFKSLDSRVNDTGFFHHLCRENGVKNLNVTNWTFGGHTISDLFGGNCQANRACGNGTDHLSYLTDNNYDYVVIQQGSNISEDLLYWVKYTMDFFREGNPDTKFIFLVHASAHNDKYPWLAQLKDIEALGATIVDWGHLVYDVYSGNTSVPGAVETYNKHSFIISKDNFHPGLLSGYIASTMVYCALTGESAVGQPYEFCEEVRSFLSYRERYYTKGGTNFPQIFSSPDDMLGLQKLMDRYLEEKYYLDN